MNKNSKFCRFCLCKDQNNFLVDFFNTSLKCLTTKLGNIGIIINLEENIPSLVCENCVNFIEKILRFLENVQNSEKILRKIYSTDQMKDEMFVIKQATPRHFEFYVEQNINEIKNYNTSESYDSDNAQSTENDNEGSKNVLPISTRSCIEPNQKMYLNHRRHIKNEKFCNAYPANDEDNNKNEIISDAVYFPGNKGINIYDKDDQNSHNEQYFFCCSKCSEIFSNPNDVVKHEIRHKVACVVCNMEVLPKSLAAHMKKHTSLFECTNCHSRHSSRAALENHFRARHAGIKGYVCHICGKQNSCQASMKRHLATHLPNKPFKCKMCGFATKSKTVLKVHILRKHSNQMTNCDICKKTFKSELSLNQHKKRIHQPKKHICKHCGKSFSEKFNLDQHTKKRHLNQRVYECKECHQEFFTVQKLKDHMHKHRPGCVSCEKCGKEFSYKKHFRKHMEKCFPKIPNITETL